MSKKFFISIFIISIVFANVFSTETECLIGGALTGFTETGNIQGMSSDGKLAMFSIYLEDSFFKNNNSKVGFYLGDLFSFPIGSSYVANTANGATKSFAIGLNVMLGPAIRLINNDSFRMQLSPFFNIGTEYERGNIKVEAYKKTYKKSYEYIGILLGAGADLNMSLASKGKSSFGFGIMTSLFPVYFPNVSVNDVSVKINVDNYIRSSVSLYAGIHFRN